MTNSLTAIALKLGILAVVIGAANIAALSWSPFFEKRPEYQATIEAASRRNDIRTLILGDSHPGTLTNELLNSSTYNMSSGGDGLKETLVKLHYALSSENRIEHLLLTADAQMFGERRRTSSNQSFIYPYVAELRLFSVYEDGFLSILLQPYLPMTNDNFIEFEKRRFSDLLSGRKSQRQMYERLREDQSLWARGLTAEERLQFAQGTGESDHRQVMESSDQTETYTRIIALAKSSGIQVTGILFPAMKPYFDGLPVENSRRHREFLDSSALDGLLDYRDFSQDPSLFKNEDHLNDVGATLLIGRIENDLNLSLASDD